MNVMVIEAKQRYYQELIERCGTDSKRLFSVASMLLGQPRSCSLPSGDPKDTAAMFSEFFISKIERIRASIPSDARRSTLMEERHRDVTTPLQSFTPISEDVLLRMISQAKPKYCDLDPIPTQWVKLASTELCPVLKRIINDSLSQGLFPDSFKAALVSPRIKKTSLNPDDPASYRPVSNLSFSSKLLERVVSQQLTQHLRDNNLEEPQQSAYRKGHSTETALLKVTTDIRLAIGERKVVAMALLDLSAAFDTVSSELLLSTLASLGVVGTALQWLRSYLTDRRQSVVVSGSCSSSQNLVCGVPQGSVLGPLLFSIYTTPLASLLRGHEGVHFHQYADDLQIYVSAEPEDLPDAVRRLEECIACVESWMNQNELKLNNSKTDFILYGHKPTIAKTTLPSLAVGEVRVMPKPAVRNIGVRLDSALTLEEQVSQVCRASCAQLKNLSRIKKCLDKKSLERLVHAYITTRLDFSNALYYGITDRILSKLQTVQNSCARLLVNLNRYAHVTPVLKQLHWLPVKERIIFKILVITYKCLNDPAFPSYLCDFITMNASVNRPTRTVNTFMITVPFTRLSYLQKTAFNHYAPLLWNQLPFHVRSAKSLPVFKSLLKTHLFLQHFD